MPTKPHTPPPPGELRNVQVKFVSLVQKGANGRRFQVFKSADYVEPTEVETDDQAPRSLLERITASVAKVLGLSDQAEVQKAGAPLAVPDQPLSTPPTFTGMMTSRQNRESFWEAKWTLDDVISAILGSEATNKLELVAGAIDQFRAHVLPLVSSFAIAKSAEAADEAGSDLDDELESLERSVSIVAVEKAGRKISTARLTKLREAYDRLGAVLAEAETGSESETEGEATEVQKEQIAQIVASAVGEALAPITQRLEKIEKAEAPAEEERREADVTEVIKAALAEALAPITGRLEKVEKARGVSNAQPVEQSAKVEKAAGFTWAGSILPVAVGDE